MHEQPIPVLMAFEPAAKGHGDHQAARHKKRGGLHSVGAVVQASAAEEVLTDLLVLFTCVECLGEIHSRRTNDQVRGDDRECRLPCVSCRQLQGDFLREPFVVVVEECDPLAGGGADSNVSSFGATDIGSEQEDADTSVVNLCQGALGLRVRAVDDDDDFDARVGLVQCGLHGFHD